MSRVNEIRTRLREQLKEEPGIMSFAYPYVRLWNKLDEKNVKEGWFLLPQKSQGILYVHIPFCLSKCGFCDYATNYGDRPAAHKSYVDAVEKEIGLLVPLTRNVKFNAVYFGGGTPTILCKNDLERIIKLVTSNFQVSQQAEVSIEVYPLKTMLRNKLKLLKNAGVNRVSIGVQDFDDAVIDFTSRKYTEEEAGQIVCEAMNLFGTVNIDLICGLPKQEKWQQTLEKTLDLKPQQVTVQPFSNRHQGILFHHPKYKPLLFGLDQIISMYDLACQMLTRESYKQTSRHQFVLGEGEHKYGQGMVQSSARLGIGAHSISLLPGLTYKNFTSLKKYYAVVDRGELPIERGFKICGDEKMRSHLFYCLSADCGGLSLPEDDFLQRFGHKIQDKFPEEVKALKEEGLIEVSAESIDLTHKGIYHISTIQRTFYNPEFMKQKEIIYGKGTRLQF